MIGADVDIVPRKWNIAAELLGKYFHEQPSGRQHIIDFAVTTKLDPFEIAPINVAIIIPVNDDGLRSDLIWSVGIEYTF